MKLWDNIRNYFYSKSLAEKVSQLNVQRKVVNWRDARSIGIVYDSSSPDNDITIAKFIEQLSKQGKQVNILGYINDTKTEHKADIPLLNKKMINWARVPVDERAAQFAGKNFDLLLACFTGENLPLEYLCRISRAQWRLGVYSPAKTGCYDMMINIGEHTDLPYLLEQSVFYLNQINYDSN